MPDIQFPTSDGNRTTLLQRMHDKFTTMPPNEVPIPAALLEHLGLTLVSWKGGVTARRTAASGQSADVQQLQTAQGTATMFVSHYIQVFNLAVRRGVYRPADRALFGLPVASADLPDLRKEADVVQWLANIATGDAALVTAGRPKMENPSAPDVALAGAAFTTLLAARDTSGEDKSKAVGQVEELRSTVDELITDIYAELKHRYRKLAPPAWREVARTYGYRFTNHRGEHPEGRYQDALAPAELRDVYQGTFDANLRLRLRNTGLTAWEIGLAPTADALPAGHTLRVEAGQEIRCGLAELGNIANQHLLIRNLSADQTGAWEIEFDAHA